MVTRPLSQIPDLAQLADPRDPLMWLRHRRGMIGRGVAYRLDVEGAERFTSASQTWGELYESATIDDPITGPATGLVALGTFAFAANSRVPSTLIVPRLVVGKKDGEGWITTITPEGNLPELDIHADTVVDVARLPEPEAVGVWDPLEFVSPAPEADAYRDGVAEAGRRLAAGTLEKVVLARRLEAQLPENADLRVPLSRLAKRYIDCWTFAVDGMIGASPETLIRSIHGNVYARVLAGTRRRSDDESRDLALAEELVTSTKEQLEHRFAVQSLVETLSPHVTDLDYDPDPEVLQLPNVWHLATKVRAKLAAGADAFELARAVHPTAAVAGTPTPLAIDTIDELEPFDRGRYAGAVGWVGAGGNGDWAIALRSAQVWRRDTHEVLTAYAGGGLVIGADPEHELAETVAKFRPIIEATGGTTPATS